MSEICRICMIKKKDLIKLIKDNSSELARSGEKFEDCFGIRIKEISDCQKICRNCELQLIDFYYFKQQALRTHNYLLDKAVIAFSENGGNNRQNSPSSEEIKHEIDSGEELSENNEKIDAGGGDDQNNDEDNIEFFNIEYLDEDAIHVDMMDVPRPLAEAFSNLPEIEIKKEVEDDDDDDDYDDDYDHLETEVEGNEHFHSQDSGYRIYEYNYSDKRAENVNNPEADKIEEDSSVENLIEMDEEWTPSPRKSNKIRIKQFARCKHRCGECQCNFDSNQAYIKHIKYHHREKDGYSQGTRVKPKKKKRINRREYKHKCNECNKYFLYDFSYEAHKNIHMGLAPYNCNICGKGFKQKINYTYHMKNHMGERNFKCELCEKAFLVKWDLELHMRSHTDARPFMCDICGKGFRIMNHLTNHRETHNETNTFECHICETKLHTQVTLKRHLASVHKIGKLKNCPWCDKQFVRLDRFRLHIAKFHEDIITVEDCNFIDFKDNNIDNFINIPDYVHPLLYDKCKNSYKEKLISSHGDKELKHECTECGKNYQHYKSFVEHFKKKHQKPNLEFDDDPTWSPLNNKEHKSNNEIDQNVKHKRKKKSNLDYNYRCGKCRKPFLQEDSYRAHLRVHEGLPPYFCDICNKGFREKNKFGYHMKNHRGERDWKCTICSKAFLIEWDLELHMRTHTDYRPFICEMCGKGFRVYCHLAEHRETHNQTNSFECKLCDAKLHTKKTLRGHMANAHRIGKIRHCPVCNHQFVRLHRLKGHMARYHSEYPPINSSGNFISEKVIVHVDVLNLD